MNRSGIQAQQATPAFKTMVETTVPYCLKILHGARDLPTVNAWANRRRSMGGGLLILRYVTPDNVQIGDIPGLTGEALRLFDGWQTLATGGVEVVLECPINEKFHTDPAEFAALAEATDHFVEAATDAGFWAGVLVTSEGNPPGDNYGVPYFQQPRVLAMLRKWRQLPQRKPGKRVIWCPHGYSHPPTAANDPWHFDRPRHILERLPTDARLNYALGEMGCDGGCDLPDKKPGVGWQGYFDPEDGRITRYAAWVRPQVAAIAADPLCIGGAFFLSGADPAGNPNFTSFDVRDEVDFRPVLTEAVAGPPITWLEPAPEVPPVATTIKGVDVSNWQRYPDFAAVKAAGYAFAFVKVSEDDYGDADYYDPYAAGNWANARAAGLVRGVYHFVRPSKSSPAESITVLQTAIAKIGGLLPGDLVALDIEDEKVLGSLHVWVAEALDLAARVLGFMPVKYSGDWYTSTRDLEHPDLAAYPTWWASYQATEPPPETGWGPIRIWQYSAHATVPGVEGGCDVDEFDGTVEELRALGKPAPVGVDWEAPVFAPIYQGASAVGGMPDKTPDDEADAQEVIRRMDAMKSRHPVA